MPSKKPLQGKRFLVTGASSGLGREICRQLAVIEGADLIVSARREERLVELKSEIAEVSHSSVVALPSDLSQAGIDVKLYRDAVGIGKLYGLINCAGATYYGPMSRQDPSQAQNLIQLNFISPMNLSRRFLADAAEEGDGILLNVTSMAAFLPAPFQSVYGATKHALQAFTENVAQEYRGSGVKVTTFAPGGISTELIEIAGLESVASQKGPFFLTAEKAAARAIRAMKRGSYREFAGPIYDIGLFIANVMPAKFVGRITAKVYRPR